jgi:hypothetical protein
MECLDCSSRAPATSPHPIDYGVAGGSARRTYERRLAARDAANTEEVEHLARILANAFPPK